jgi:hypothetical protein
MRQSISLHQFFQEVPQQLPFSVVVSISPFAMTQDTMLYSAVFSHRQSLSQRSKLLSG